MLETLEAPVAMTNYFLGGDQKRDEMSIETATIKCGCSCPICSCSGGVKTRTEAQRNRQAQGDKTYAGG